MQHPASPCAGTTTGLQLSYPVRQFCKDCPSGNPPRPVGHSTFSHFPDRNVKLSCPCRLNTVPYAVGQSSSVSEGISPFPIPPIANSWWSARWTSSTLQLAVLLYEHCLEPGALCARTVHGQDTFPAPLLVQCRAGASSSHPPIRLSTTQDMPWSMRRTRRTGGEE